MAMNRNDKETIAREIRMKYVGKERSMLDKLKALDRKVNRPAEILAFTLGILGAIIMGSGMSLIMTDIGATIGVENTMVAGIVLGIAGMIAVCVNYPIYKKLLASRRRKYADEIIKLSDEIIK